MHYIDIYVVVWRKDLYISEAEGQPYDATAYTEVHHDPTDEIELKKLKFFTAKKLIKDKKLPTTAYKLIHHCPKTSNFCILPKTHRENSPRRPIVLACSCPTAYMSKFKDVHSWFTNDHLS